MAALGVALISQHTVAKWLRSGRPVALRGIGPPIMRNWYLQRRANCLPSPATLRARDKTLVMRGGFLPQA